MGGQYQLHGGAAGRQLGTPADRRGLFVYVTYLFFVIDKNDAYRQRADQLRKLLFTLLRLAYRLLQRVLHGVEGV